MASIDLPTWACVGERRRAHIERVTTLLLTWADEMRLPTAERAAWRDAGLLHDALRDAPEEALRAILGDSSLPAEMLHGPAAAVRLAQEGEERQDVLQAVRWHTVGSAAWGPVGRALYMADFLEPGRSGPRARRDQLAAQVAGDFEGVFREVVRQRLAWSLREGQELFQSTVDMWNSVR